MTRLPSLLPLVVLLFACGGSGGSGSIDIVGATPEDAAEEISDAVCDLTSNCPNYDISCTSSETGTECEITEDEVQPYEACVAELQPEILEDLNCVDLSAAQEELINTCVNGLLAQGCQTLAEVEAIVADIEAGNEPDEPTQPPECEALGELFDGCGAQ